MGAVHLTRLNETSPEFWRMSNMEYLQLGYVVCKYVLSIEYEHGIFALGVGDMHHYHCWVGDQRCCKIDQGAHVGPLNTQYFTLGPNPRTLSIIITVGYGQKCCQLFFAFFRKRGPKT